MILSHDLGGPANQRSSPASHQGPNLDRGAGDLPLVVDGRFPGRWASVRHFACQRAALRTPNNLESTRSPDQSWEGVYQST